MQAADLLSSPIPFEAATHFVTHEYRTALQWSPDGQWISHTDSYHSSENPGEGNDHYSATGATLAEGNARLRAELTHTRTGEVVTLGEPSASSWNAVWSPDGQQVVFYSDEGGQAGLWRWDRTTHQSSRFAGAIVRPLFGFETPVWFRDSQRVLCKLLPEGQTVAQANALGRRQQKGMAFDRSPDGAAVFVLHSQAQPLTDSRTPGVTETPLDLTDFQADLAILDWHTHRIQRMATGAHPRWYSLSPDERFIAYTDLTGVAPHSQQALFDIKLFELASGQTRTLAHEVRLSYGIEINWSPTSRSLAYIESGQLASRQIRVLTIDGTAPVSLAASGGVTLDVSNGMRSLLWSARGDALFAIGTDGNLWRGDLASATVRGGAMRRLATIAGHRIQSMIAQFGSPEVWTRDRDRNLWVVARDRDSQNTGLYRADLDSGAVTRLLDERRSYQTGLALDANHATAAIAYVAQDDRHMTDVWLFDTTTRATHQVTHLNKDLERYSFGSARLLHWFTADGTALQGTLLLPSDYVSQRRVPLLVWIYGGEAGSQSLRTFGIWSDPAFNFQLLATRGYAILYPDAPFHSGSSSADLLKDVMPAVEATIAAGYIDPDRLAVGGQSYGSYSTLALITQTTRFKAAIISAVVHPDLLDMYLEMAPDGNDAGLGYFEHGHGNMGGTPWEYPQRYLENSPIYQFDKIQTPLLIAQGSMDGTLLRSASATFVALRRLGKEVEFRVYEGEGHVVSRRGNVIDFWRRRVSFLDAHLDISRGPEGAIRYSGDRPLSSAAAAEHDGN
jgi:dipeptidyl aminopeptidase/acylaminoacyl peptidase